MAEDGLPVIVVHAGELNHPEQTGSKIVRALLRNSKYARFVVKIPDREHRPITSGPQDDDI